MIMSWTEQRNQQYSEEKEQSYSRPHLIDKESFKNFGFRLSWGLQQLSKRFPELRGLKLHVGVYSPNIDDLNQICEDIARIVWRYEHEYPIGAKFYCGEFAKGFIDPSDPQRGKQITIYFPFNVDPNFNPKGLMAVMVTLIENVLQKYNSKIWRISADPRYNFCISDDCSISVRASSDFYDLNRVQAFLERFGNPVEIARRLGWEFELKYLRHYYKDYLNSRLLSRIEVQNLIRYDPKRLVGNFVAVPIETLHGVSYRMFRIVENIGDNMIRVVEHDGDLRQLQNKLYTLDYVSQNPLQNLLNTPYYKW